MILVIVRLLRGRDADAQPDPHLRRRGGHSSSATASPARWLADVDERSRGDVARSVRDSAPSSIATPLLDRRREERAPALARRAVPRQPPAVAGRSRSSCSPSPAGASRSRSPDRRARRRSLRRRHEGAVAEAPVAEADAHRFAPAPRRRPRAPRSRARPRCASSCAQTRMEVMLVVRSLPFLVMLAFGVLNVIGNSAGDRRHVRHRRSIR